MTALDELAALPQTRAFELLLTALSYFDNGKIDRSGHGVRMISDHPTGEQELCYRLSEYFREHNLQNVERTAQHLLENGLIELAMELTRWK